MKLTQLEYFIAVCRHNNITNAANELHVSQPSVSNSILQLEQEFGVKLLYRSSKKISLTQEGEFFLERAEDILSKSNILHQQMCDFGSQKNNIRIGIPPMIGTILFPSVLQSFERAYPNITNDITEQGSEQTIKMVLEDTLDVALVVIDDLSNDNLNVLSVLETQVLFCVNAQNPLTKFSTVSLEMIQNETIVMYKDGYYLRRLILDRYANAAITPKIALTTNQLYTSKNMVLNGIASAYLFKEIAQRENDIVGIPLQDPITLHIGLVWKKGRYLYSDIAKFINFVKEYKF